MSTLKTNNVQVGQSVTATNNFTLYQPSSPDGTVRLGVGNTGATTADVITANSSGNVGIGTSSPRDVTDYVTLALNDTTGGLIDFLAAGTRVATVTGNSSNLTLGTVTATPIVFNTNTNEAARIDTNRNFSITQTPGRYTVDVTGGATSIANGGTVDFSNASGMLVVNNHSNGGVTIYLCGGGSVTTTSSVIGTVGSFAYVGGINGYRWTNNFGSTATFGFFFVRTRPNA